MKKHLNVLILIVVAVLALAIVAVAYWQLVQENKSFDWKKFGFISQPKPIVYEELKTTMDTSDWLYFDGKKEYGITFKYPKDWEVTRGLADLSLGPKNCPNLTEKGYENIKGASVLFDLAGVGTKETIREIWNVEEEKGVIVDGQKGIKIIGIEKDGGQKKGFIEIENMSLMMNGFYSRTSGDCLDSLKEISFMEAVVSTMKFYR